MQNWQLQKSMEQQLKEQLQQAEKNRTMSTMTIPSRHFEWPEVFTIEQRRYIGSAICDIRREKRMTQNELESKLNMKVGTVSLLEKGKMKVDKVFLKRVAKALGDDLNQHVMDACSDEPVEKAASPNKVSAIAGPGKLIIDQETTHRIPIDDIEFKVQVSDRRFELFFNQKGQDIKIGEGLKIKNSILAQALRHISKLIEG